MVLLPSPKNFRQFYSRMAMASRHAFLKFPSARHTVTSESELETVQHAQSNCSWLAAASAGEYAKAITQIKSAPIFFMLLNLILIRR